MTDLWANIWDKVRIEDILSEPSHEEIVERTANYISLRGKTILEVGSGSGGTGYELTKHGARVTLMDLSPAALRLSHRLFDAQNVLGTYVCGDIHHIPFADDSFDISVSYGVLEHFPKEEIVQILREMRRVSRGTIVTTVPNARCAFYRIAKRYAEKNGTWQYGYEQPEYSMEAYFQESGITLAAEESIGFLDSLHFLGRIPSTQQLIRCALEFTKEHPDDLDGSLILSVGKVDERPRKSVSIAAPSPLADRAEQPHPLVSVIMPAYQSAPYIGHAIQSVLAQTWKDFELIIVDDGSTDSTREIVEGFQDPRIRYAYKTNGGEADACNFGLNMARGELIGWLDADDTYRSDCLETEVKALLEDPRTSFVYPNLGLMDEHTRATGIVWRYKTMNRSQLVAELFQKGRSCFPGRASTMARRSLLNRVGPFDTERNISTDYDYLVRLAREAEFCSKHIDQVLYYYRRVVPDSLKDAVKPGSAFIAIKNVNERNRNVIAVMKKMIASFLVEELIPDFNWGAVEPAIKERDTCYKFGEIFFNQAQQFPDQESKQPFLQEARDYFQKARLQDPTHVGSISGMMKVDLIEGNRRSATEALREITRLFIGNTETLVNVVNDLLCVGAQQEALALCQQFVKDWPDDPIAFNCLGYLYHHLAMARDAIAAFERALQLNPAYQEARDNLNSLKNQAVLTSSSVARGAHPGTMEFSRKFWTERGRKLPQGGFNGPGYETSSGVTEQAFRELIAGIGCGEPGMRLLEVGCGFGHSLELFKRTFPDLQMTAIDFSLPLLMQAKELLAAYPEIQLLQADAISLPFSDGSFDVAFTHGLLIHIPPAHIRQAIVELFRVAKVGLLSESSSGADTGYYFSHNYESLFQELGLSVRARRITDEKTNSRIFLIVKEASQRPGKRTSQRESPNARRHREAPEPLTLLYLADARSPHTQRLANFFAGRGHRVHVFDTSGSTSGLKGVSVHTPALNGSQGFENQFLRIMHSLQRVIEQTKPHIVHGHYLTGWGWWGACCGFRPYVLTAWGSDVFLDPQFSPLNQRLNRYALRRSSLITADSKDLLQATAALRGIHAEPAEAGSCGIEYVPFGIDLDIYHDGYDTTQLRNLLSINGSQVVLSPRQFKPHSNIETLIHAIPEVLKEVPNTVFLLKTYLTAGTPYEVEIQNLVKDLGVEEQVRFLSDLPQEQMPVLYNLADVMLSLRETDGSACSMLEAMACKTPIIASDIPSMREWIQDGVNGRLVDPHDVRQVKEALVSLLKDSRQKQRIAAASYKVVQEFGDYRKWWNHLEGLYYDLSKNHAQATEGIGPHAGTLAQGWGYLRSGLWAKAEEEFRQVTLPGKVSAEDLVEALFGLVNCTLKSQRGKEAATFCHDAFTLVQNFELDQTLNLER